MSSLTSTEKRKFEQFLGMTSGYVLDFTNRTFEEFIRDSTGREIYHERYSVGSGSKAQRLRAFWQKEDDATVGKLMTDMLDYSEATGAQVELCRLMSTQLRGEKAGAQPQCESSAPAQSAFGQNHYERLALALKTVMGLAPTPRGFEFERFLDDVFATFNLAPRKSFRLVGEQIDGSFHLAHETYLVEAKWQDAQVGNQELQAFAAARQGEFVAITYKSDRMIQTGDKRWDRRAVGEVEWQPDGTALVFLGKMSQDQADIWVERYQWTLGFWQELGRENPKEKGA